MQIRDLECKAVLDRATIRYYEREGLIVPNRKENGYREYSEDNLMQLLKIKLLRQLGMSLDTIKNIQQGSADFNQALSIQIRNLENVMQAAARAKDVCTELYRANTSYDELDAVYYLQQLNRRQSKTVTRNFREHVQRPYHPTRRFLARMTDYAILRILLEFLLVVVLRIRPYSEFLSGLITYGTPFLMVPIISWMIQKWGTTPGKWIYGLSVLSDNGCKLSYADAREREWRVLAEGYGFGIPVWSVIRLWKSYKTYQEYDMDWDTFCEFHFDDWDNRRKGIIAVSAAVIAIISFITISDAMRPRHRGDITISEFASNYNFYYRLLNDQPIADPKMGSDGKWYPESNGQVILDVAGQPEYPNQNFEFQTDGTSVRSIRYENSWTDIFLLNPVTGQCKIAALTAVMSQKGIGLFDIVTFLREMDSADMLNDGEIIYKNIKINWDVEEDNCSVVSGGYFISTDDTKVSHVSVVFEIMIQ